MHIYKFTNHSLQSIEKSLRNKVLKIYLVKNHWRSSAMSSHQCD